MQSYGASNRRIWSKKSRDLAKKQPLDLDLGFARKPRRGAALFTGGGSEVAGVGVSPERR